MISSGNDLKIGAVYGRVSVDEAAEVEHGSLEQQIHLGRELAQGLTMSTGIPHSVKYNLIEERGVSGKNTNRPKYQELITLIQSRQIDFVIAKEISRISRSTRDFCDFLSLCKENEVAVHIRGMAADPNSPMGELIFKIFAMIAEFERQQIVERTKSSIRSAMKNNGKIHGGPVPLGFDKDPVKKGSWIPNLEELKLVESIMNKFNEKLSYKEVVDELNSLGIKTKTGSNFRSCSLKRLLTNHKYIGKMQVPTDSKEEIWVELPFGAVIDKELFEVTQASVKKMESLYGLNQNRRRIYALTGLLVHEDGSTFAGQSGTARSGEPKFYYYNKKHKLSISAPKIEKAVFGSLRVFENNEKMIGYANEIKKKTFSKLDFVNQQILKRKNELKQIEQEEKGLLMNLNEAKGSNSRRVLDWLDSQLESIEKKKVSVSEAIILLERERDDLSSANVDANSLKRSLKAVFDRLDKASPDVQRGLARQLFNSIKVCKGNKVEILWNLPCGESGKSDSQGSKWGGRWDSNPRQTESQSAALPTELHPP